MDSIREILVNKNLDEPTELTALREYCQKHELGELIITLDAMEKTFDYYGGNIK